MRSATRTEPPSRGLRSATVALAVAALATGAVACGSGSGSPGVSLAADPSVTTVARMPTDVAHPTVAADPPRHRVYVAWTTYPGDNAATSWLATSEDDGRTFRAPARMPGTSEDHPVLKVADDGTLYASWSHWDPARRFFPKDKYDNPSWQRLATSTDGGRTLSTPVAVPTGAERRMRTGYFMSMNVSRDGRTVAVSWLDYTPGILHQTPPGSPAGVTEGAPFDAAVSTDGGRTFGPQHRLAAISCVCCMPQAFILRGRPGFLFRGLEAGNVRNPMVVTARDGAGTAWNAPVTVNPDGFRLKVCPHVGLGAGVDRDDTLHVAWWTGAEGRKAIWYSTSRDGRSFAAPVKVEDMPAAPHDHDVTLAVDRSGTSWIVTAVPHPAKGGEGARLRLWAVPSGGAPTRVPDIQAEGGLPDVAAADAGVYLVWARKGVIRLQRVGGAT